MASGIIHRDIKPDNLMLDRERRVRIVDLGTAVLLEGDTRRGHAGTLPYMAPEVCREQGQDVVWSFSADIWSLAVTTLHLLRGSLPEYLDPNPGGRDLPYLPLRVMDATADKVLAGSDEKLIPLALQLLLRLCLQGEPGDRLSCAQLKLQRYFCKSM